MEATLTQKSDSVLRENTGTAVPAPLNPGLSKIDAECLRGKGHPGIGLSMSLSYLSCLQRATKVLKIHLIS